MASCSKNCRDFTNRVSQSKFRLSRWVSSSEFKSVSPRLLSFLLEIGSGISSIFEHIALLFHTATSL